MTMFELIEKMILLEYIIAALWFFGLIMLLYSILKPTLPQRHIDRPDLDEEMDTIRNDTCPDCAGPLPHLVFGNQTILYCPKCDKLDEGEQ